MSSFHESKNESDYPKLHKLLDMYRDIITIHDALPEIPNCIHKGYIGDKGNFKMTKMIHYFMTNFPNVATKDGDEWEAEIKEVSAMFSGDSSEAFNQKLWDVPPTLLPQLIIIAILRDALATRKMRINPSAMTLKVRNKDVNVWNEFCKVYSYIVLAC